MDTLGVFILEFAIMMLVCAALLIVIWRYSRSLQKKTGNSPDSIPIDEPQFQAPSNDDASGFFRRLISTRPSTGEKERKEVPVKLSKKGGSSRLRRLFSRRSQNSEEKKNEAPAKLNSAEVKELLVSKPECDEEIELKRIEAYIDGPTQKLLRSLLEKGRKTMIVPSYDPAFGFRYEMVESILDGNNPGEAEDLLERLNHLEILERSFFDTVTACPECGSTSITLHYRCPKCQSRHVVRTGLTEHIPCGNIDEREHYDQGRLQFACPQCGAKLVEGEYRDMGLWYVCRECAEKFEHPGLDLTCRLCSNQFTVQTGLVREVSKYALNAKREHEIRQNVTSLEGLNRLLTDLEFTTEMSASAIGEKSGIQHNFSLIARKNVGDQEKIVAVDHAVGDVEVGASPLILYSYKVSEIKVDLPVFVAIPKLSETARRIARGYNIMVIEGIPREKEQLATLQEELQRRLQAQQIAKQKISGPLEIENIHQWIIRRSKKVDVWRDMKGRFIKSTQIQELKKEIEDSKK